VSLSFRAQCAWLIGRCLLGLALASCSAAPVDPQEDAADSPDVSGDALAPAPDASGADASAPDVSVGDTHVADVVTPIDSGWSDPDCVSALGCDSTTSSCASGPVWAYGKWAYFCGNTSKLTTLVACSYPHDAGVGLWPHPPCAPALAGYDSLNVYYCCAP
jgi:hypothetical protein